MSPKDPEQQPTEAPAESLQEQQAEAVAAEQNAVEPQAADTDSADQQRVAELELALSQAEQRATDAADQAVRAVAEMENVRRRAAAEVDKAHKFALEKFANELLTTVDNLERALTMTATAEQQEGLASFVEGIELTHKGLLSTLQRFGVEAVGAVGENFNPELHQAMAMQPSDEQPNNSVLAVLQKGYTLQGRLLRPAMVMVVKNS
jgi:molecular chaperone GrpE